MTKTRQPNPIFDRALQHSRWPSPRATLLLFGGFVLGGAVYIGFIYYLSTVDPYFSGDGARLSVIIFGLLSLLVAILSAPLSALLTCLNLPKELSGDAFQTVRLTGLSRRKIVAGYLLNSLYRLRLLWVLTFGMLFILTFFLIYGLDDFGLSLSISATGGVVGISLNWLAICTGLWLSIRWGERWIVLTVTLSATVLALVLSLGGLWLSDFALWFPILAFAISVTLSLFFFYQAEQQI